MRPALRLRSRRGNYATITALSLTVLLGFGALAIDVSHVHLVDQQLQTAADASAHAAVMMLDGSEEGLAAAKTAAGELAQANYAGGQKVTLDDSGSPFAKAVFGVWDAEARSFDESEDPEEVNAVRVTTGHENTSTAALGSLTDIKLSPRASSTAVRDLQGAGAVECFIPLAIPSCLIETAYGEDGIQDIDLVLNPKGVDNVGWARPAASPNASWLKGQLTDCKGDGEVAIGDSLGLQNGVVASAMSAMASELEGSATGWDGDVWGAMPAQLSNSAISNAAYGNTLEGPLFVFEDDSYCSGGGKFNGFTKVSGFVWGAVYDVATKGAADTKNIRVRLDTSREHGVGTASGGKDWGVQNVHFSLAE